MTESFTIKALNCNPNLLNQQMSYSKTRADLQKLNEITKYCITHDQTNESLASKLERLNVVIKDKENINEHQHQYDRFESRPLNIQINRGNRKRVNEKKQIHKQMQSSGRPMKKDAGPLQRKFQVKPAAVPALDTGSINPPLQIEQIQSPMKKRPQSGGASPDKFKLAKQEYDQREKQKYHALQAKLAKQQEAEAFLRKKEQVFKDSREASIALKRAQAEVMVTQQEIKKQIEKSENTLNMYKKQIAELQSCLKTKVEEKLEMNNYQVIKIDKVQNHDLEQIKEKFASKIDRGKVAYKYAFGQKIQVDYTWQVKQQKMTKGQNSNRPLQQDKPKESRIVYDYNGRPIRQRPNYDSSPVQQQSKEESVSNSQNLDLQNVQTQGDQEKEETPEPLQRKGPKQYPDWFYNKHTGETEAEEEGQDARTDELSEADNYGFNQQKRVQKDIMIRSKSKSATRLIAGKFDQRYQSGNSKSALGSVLGNVRESMRDKNMKASKMENLRINANNDQISLAAPQIIDQKSANTKPPSSRQSGNADLIFIHPRSNSTLTFNYREVFQPKLRRKQNSKMGLKTITTTPMEPPLPRPKTGQRKSSKSGSRILSRQKSMNIKLKMNKK